MDDCKYLCIVLSSFQSHLSLPNVYHCLLSLVRKAIFEFFLLSKAAFTSFCSSFYSTVLQYKLDQLRRSPFAVLEIIFVCFILVCSLFEFYCIGENFNGSRAFTSKFLTPSNEVSEEREIVFVL